MVNQEIKKMPKQTCIVKKKINIIKKKGIVTYPIRVNECKKIKKIHMKKQVETVKENIYGKRWKKSTKT